MSDKRQGVYVWEFPIRFAHWINFLCIIVLTLTGFYIGRPFIHAYSSEEYIMGWVRLIHFIAAYIFLMSMIIRIYWAFLGNKYASFKVWFPLTGRKIADLVDTLKFYLFISKKPPHTVGHTPLAGFTYLFVFLLFIFQINLGFAMYSVNHTGAVWAILGGWVLNIMHLQTVRLFHHIIMYVILAFVIVHVYIGWYLDSKEKNGLMGSIFGGYKFVTGKE
ncbi:MAG: Ni/Fe-hydrogenase, b-type cytochrome subunit [Nitrospiraceae bacterium]|nr:MAG: Ni/Fe-hydrogenase, b-type cytochrome subunit [Nitrospiraceae bacterium]